MSSHPLFSTFPREVLALTRTMDNGIKIPTRSVVLSQKELNLFVKKYAGVQDLYVGSFIYEGNTGNTTVDKLPFDFDDEHSKYAPKFAKWLKENKIGYVVVGTYFDRYHIYVPVYPQKATPLELQEAQLSLLEQAEIYEKIDNGNGSYYQPMTDTHIIGDIRRVMRMPNTPRLPKKEGGSITCYSTYLPQNFYELEKSEVYSMLKQPNDMETPDFYPRPLFEIVKPLTRDFRSMLRIYVNTEDVELQYIPKDPLLKFVQSILRPCVWKSLVSANPPHFIRVAATIDLRDLGFSQMQIFDVFSKLDWVDWNADVCSYQVSDILSKTNYKRYSCRKIISSGFPCDPNCNQKNNGHTWTPIEV